VKKDRNIWSDVLLKDYNISGRLQAEEYEREGVVANEDPADVLRRSARTTRGKQPNRFV